MTTTLNASNSGSGGLVATADASGVLALQTAGTTAVTVDASQNVGIGTASPSKKLEVYAAANSLQIESIVRNDQAGSGVAAIGFNVSSGAASETTSTKAGIGLVRSSSYGVGSLCFYNNGTTSAGDFTTADERMRIDSSGNVLVGSTVDLKAPLTVNKAPASSAYGQIAAISLAASDVGNAGMSVTKYDNVTTTSQVLFRFLVNQGATASGQINANGASAAAFGSYSDSRLKENIVDLPSQLANIMALRPVEYDYIKSEGGGHQIGFVAQEVQTIYPDLVGERADGMLTLTDMNKNDARLIKAIQEQQALITSLTARIAALEGTPA